MPIALTCRCSAAFKVPDNHAGKTSMCPECGEFLDVPEPGKKTFTREERYVVLDEEPDEPSPRELKRQIRDAIEDEIEPVRRTAGYGLGVAVVAMAMLAMPALYVGLILLVVYGIYWHVTENVSFFRTMHIFWAIVLYLGTLLALVILLAFMIKPLLARPAKARRGKLVNLEQEPVLAALVDNIAWAVHAPKPKRIEVDCDVNASAGFGTSFFGMFSNNLTLTIGLPLVVGLSARQFSGVLAHEFGHFAQGAGMRLSYVIRSINAWFARVVHERDAWDEEVRDWCQDNSVWSLVGVMVRVGVGFTRGILWVFMIIAHGLSCFLMRRMEFDADRSEVRLVGAKTFEKTFRRIALMSAADIEAREIVVGCWMNDRYPDDYATLVVELADSLPTRQREDVLDDLEEASTGIFDSHPSFADRLASGEKEDTDGVFTLSMPAIDLFRNYSKLASAASINHYKGMLGWGLRPSLRPVTEYLRGRA